MPAAMTGTPGVCLPGSESGDGFFPLTGGTVYAGRAAKCALRFAPETPGVSAVHCAVRWDAQRRCFAVRDMGSANGTCLETGMRLQPNRLYRMLPGDVIFLGGPEHSLRMEWRENNEN